MRAARLLATGVAEVDVARAVGVRPAEEHRPAVGGAYKTVEARFWHLRVLREQEMFKVHLTTFKYHQVH